MAFVRVESWTVERPSLGRRVAASITPYVPKNLPAIPFGQHLKRPAAIMLTAALHIIVGGFLLTRMADVDIAEMMPDKILTRLPLSKTPDEEAAGEIEQSANAEFAAAQKQSDQNNPSAPEVPVAEYTAPSPPEWSVSRIKVASAAPSKNSGAANQGQSAASGGGGTGNGGNAYDPYAGAAQQRLGGGEVTINWDNTNPKLDRRAFTAWLERLKTRLPRARGTVLLEVNVDMNGKVISASVIGGEALPQVQQFARQFVVGEQFFREGGKFKIPVIELG